MPSLNHDEEQIAIAMQLLRVWLNCKWPCILPMPRGIRLNYVSRSSWWEKSQTEVTGGNSFSDLDETRASSWNTIFSIRTSHPMHVISLWWHDFQPDQSNRNINKYFELVELRLFPRYNVLMIQDCVHMFKRVPKTPWDDVAPPKIMNSPKLPQGVGHCAVKV